MNVDWSQISKALAGALAGAIVALLARYGMSVSAGATDALDVLLTALVGAAIGHMAVYLAPANTKK